MPRSSFVGIIVACAFWIGAPARSQGLPDGVVRVESSRVTGHANFVVLSDRLLGAPGTVPVWTSPDAFLRDQGRLFGITDRADELRETAARRDQLGFRRTTFDQVFHGVPVFSGRIFVHQNGRGEVVSANGDFYPIQHKLTWIPTLSKREAERIAQRVLADPGAQVEKNELVIVDPGWYGDPPIGPHLAYHLILVNLNRPSREALFVDAHDGGILDQWTLLETARFRVIYDGNGMETLPGTLARVEGDPSVPSPTDVDRAYDYLGDTYDYFFRGFGRDGIDAVGSDMVATINSTNPPCPNALWSGTQMAFCDGTVTDDVTAHELGHGVMQYTADLIYQNQPGQLNESFSDIWGELIDLFNGDAGFVGPPGGPAWPAHPTGAGADTPNTQRTACSPLPSYPDGVRWLFGEDATAFGGVIRDMWDPTCLGDPDRANSPLQTCPSFDNGGVHRGSGIPNHAFAMLTDGKMFNGYTVTGIGPIKAAAVWYRALTTYLTPSTDFKEAYVAFNQAALDLIGSFPDDPRTGLPSADMFTTNDAQQVDSALLAVEMNTDGPCGYVCDAVSCPPVNDACADATVVTDGVHSYTTVCGSLDGPETVPGGTCESTAPVPFARDVWYEYTATCSGVLTVSLCGGPIVFGDMLAAVYGDGSAACACPSTNDTLMACADDSCGPQGGSPIVQVPVIAGGCYLIRLAGYGGYADQSCGTFQIECTAPDACELAESVACNGSVTFNNASNPAPPVPPYSCGFQTNHSGTQWYKFTATATSARLQTCHSVKKDSTFAVYDGCGTLMELGCSEDGGCTGASYLGNICVQGLTPGQEYVVQISAWNAGSRGTYKLEIACPCDPPPGPQIQTDVTGRANRTLSLSAANPPPNGPPLQSLRITMTELQNPIPPNPPCCLPPDFSGYEAGASCVDPGGCVRWVGPPMGFLESQGNGASGTARIARLQCTPFEHDWFSEGPFYVHGAEIVPSSTYQIDLCEDSDFLCGAIVAAGMAHTARWGDVASPFNPPSTSSQPDGLDVVALVNKFKNIAGSPSKPVAQLQPNVMELNTDVNALDIVAVVDGFRGQAYQYSGPCACPSSVTCDATPCTVPAQCTGGLCVKTCIGGTNGNQPCVADGHCPGGTCGTGFCRDRCGRCN